MLPAQVNSYKIDGFRREDGVKRCQSVIEVKDEGAIFFFRVRTFEFDRERLKVWPSNTESFVDDLGFEFLVAGSDSSSLGFHGINDGRMLRSHGCCARGRVCNDEESTFT